MRQALQLEERRRLPVRRAAKAVALIPSHVPVAQHAGKSCSVNPGSGGKTINADRFMHRILISAKKLVGRSGRPRRVNQKMPERQKRQISGKR